ncbi:MAG: hypothetical protein ACK4F9_06380 [Brevinematia bacterium]
MKINFIAVSGKIYDDNMEIYTKSGKRYYIYTVYINNKTWIKLIYKNRIVISDQENVVLFGKIINLYGTLGILLVEYKKLY